MARTKDVSKMKERARGRALVLLRVLYVIVIEGTRGPPEELQRRWRTSEAPHGRRDCAETAVCASPPHATQHLNSTQSTTHSRLSGRSRFTRFSSIETPYIVSDGVRFQLKSTAHRVQSAHPFLSPRPLHTLRTRARFHLQFTVLLRVARVRVAR